MHVLLAVLADAVPLRCASVLAHRCTVLVPRTLHRSVTWELRASAALRCSLTGAPSSSLGRCTALSHGSCAPPLRFGARSNALEVEQAGCPPLGPAQRGADELAEEGVGAIGAALELGVGLRADPEGMPCELEELHEAVVGRRARGEQAGFFHWAA